MNTQKPNRSTAGCHIDRRARLVFSTFSGSRNSGDEAIITSLLNDLKPLTDDICVFSVDPAYTRKIHHVKALPQRPWRAPWAILCSIARCDLFILGGGGLLQDESNIFTVPAWLSKLILALILRRKTLVLANSIGPLRYPWNRWLVKTVLKRVDRITVRDQSSARLLRQLRIPAARIQLTADPAFRLRPGRISRPHPRRAVFLMRHWYDAIPWVPVSWTARHHIRLPADQRRWEHLISRTADAADWLSTSHNYQIDFRSMCGGRDHHLGDAVVSRLPDAPVRSLAEYLPPFDLLKALQPYSLIVTMRLHGIIYAILLARPFIALTYSDKCRALLQYLGLAKFGIDIDRFTPRSFQRKTAAVLRDYSLIREQLKHVKRRMSKLALDNIAVIRELTAGSRR